MIKIYPDDFIALNQPLQFGAKNISKHFVNVRVDNKPTPYSSLQANLEVKIEECHIWLS